MDGETFDPHGEPRMVRKTCTGTEVWEHSYVSRRNGRILRVRVASSPGVMRGQAGEGEGA